MNTTSQENKLRTNHSKILELGQTQFKLERTGFSTYMSPTALPEIDGQNINSYSIMSKIRSKFAQNKKKLIRAYLEELKGQKVIGATNDDGLSA